MKIVQGMIVLTCAFIILIGLAGAARADGPVVVVANKGISEDSFSKKDVRNIFLGKKKKLAGGQSAKIVTLTVKDLHAEFLKSFINKTSSQWQRYYRQLVFSGKGSNPKTFGREQALIQYVAKTDGALGYASQGSVTDKVKMIQVTD